jgi:hypothetical protein
VYAKFACFQPSGTAALVRETVIDIAKVIDSLPNGRRSILPGREVFFLDGNHLALPSTDWRSCA